MVVLSLGAGVQSSTLALMAAVGEIGPMPDCAIFADTQAEPPSVYQWLDWLTPQLPFPVHRVSRGNLASDSLQLFTSKVSGRDYQRNLIPLFIRNRDGSRGILSRRCTADYKVEVIERKVRQLVRPRRGEQDVLVTQWIGISRDEAHRMKPSRLAWIQNQWPLIERGMTRQNCLTWMEAHGYPLPPRSACVFCPYHSDQEWARLQREEPKAFAAAVEWERQAREVNKQDMAIRGEIFVHDSLRPLSEIDFVQEQDRARREQPSLWGNECEGMCGV